MSATCPGWLPSRRPAEQPATTATYLFPGFCWPSAGPCHRVEIHWCGLRVSLPRFEPHDDPGPSFAALLRRADAGRGAEAGALGALGGHGTVVGSHEIPHGTTCVAVRYGSGVVLAGDRRATAGHLISNHLPSGAGPERGRRSGVGVAVRGRRLRCGHRRPRPGARCVSGGGGDRRRGLCAPRRRGAAPAHRQAAAPPSQPPRGQRGGRIMTVPSRRPAGAVPPSVNGLDASAHHDGALALPRRCPAAARPGSPSRGRIMTTASRCPAGGSRAMAGSVRCSSRGADWR